jgi:hypothetical protein
MHASLPQYTITLGLGALASASRISGWGVWHCRQVREERFELSFGFDGSGLIDFGESNFSPLVVAAENPSLAVVVDQRQQLS